VDEEDLPYYNNYKENSKSKILSETIDEDDLPMRRRNVSKSKPKKTKKAKK
jgi:hypothetical protein